MSRHTSNWRSTRPLDEWLAESRIPVIENVDTRRLTRHIRERGAMRGVIAEGREPTPQLTLQLMDSPFDERTRPARPGQRRRRPITEGMDR